MCIGRKKTTLLTIEFKFHAPANPSAPSSQPREPVYTLLTHKNRFETPLLTLIQLKVTERINSHPHTDDRVPGWVPSLVHPDLDDPDSFTPPQCFITAETDPRSGLRSQSAFYKLDPAQKLSVLLRDTHFVEFPTIEVWEEGDAAFPGTIVDAQGSVTRYAEDDADGERRTKRRRLDVKAGKKAINGLLGNYGSDDETPDEGEGKEEKGVLALLGDYAGSDEDSGLNTDGEGAGAQEEEVKVDLSPGALAELVRQAQALDAAEDDDDLVDWGDSDGEPT